MERGRREECRGRGGGDDEKYNWEGTKKMERGRKDEKGGGNGEKWEKGGEGGLKGGGVAKRVNVVLRK
jgi:hypothetical protein